MGDNIISQQKSRKLTMGGVIGTVLILFGLILLFTKVSAALLFIVSGLILFPSIQLAISKWIKVELSKGVRALAAIVMIVVAVVLLPNPANDQTPVSTSEVVPTSQQEIVKPTTATKPAPKTATSASVPAPQPQAPTVPQFRDGNFVVGTDIQPGTYRTRKASSGCYYSRLSGFGGSFSEIISNENTDAPAVVTIAATDKGFKSTRCGTWTQDLSAITTSQTSFGDGIFIVGTDLQVGTYRSTGGSSCYYSRLKDFSSTISGIISNDNTSDSAIVTIAASDTGFKSTRCGTWTKI
jgi:hypothetical protein